MIEPEESTYRPAWLRCAAVSSVYSLMFLPIAVLIAHEEADGWTALPIGLVESVSIVPIFMLILRLRFGFKLSSAGLELPIAGRVVSWSDVRSLEERRRGPFPWKRTRAFIVSGIRWRPWIKAVDVAGFFPDWRINGSLRIFGGGSTPRLARLRPIGPLRAEPKLLWMSSSGGERC